MLGISTGLFAWGVIGLFFFAAFLDIYTDRTHIARTVAFVAWGLFGVFWASLVPYFLFEQRSFIEGGLALLALPACTYAGYILYTGRDSLFTLTQAVAIMGLIYLPVETVPLVHQTLIEATTTHTEWAMQMLGYTPAVETGGSGLDGYRNSFVFPVDGESHVIRFSIILACTGLGSIAIFTGLVLSTPAPLRTRFRALTILIPTIYALNVARTTFIAIVFGTQQAHIAPDTIMALFGLTDPYLVSFIIADRIIAQSFALLTLIALGILTLKLVPQLAIIAEDVLYLLTRNEYDLEDALGSTTRDPAEDNNTY